MSDTPPKLDLSGEELDLLVTATSAYQHNEKFNALHQKLGKYRLARHNHHSGAMQLPINTPSSSNAQPVIVTDDIPGTAHGPRK